MGCFCRKVFHALIVFIFSRVPRISDANSRLAKWFVEIGFRRIMTEKLNSSGLFDLEFRVFATTSAVSDVAYSLATTQRQFTSVSRGWKLAITNA